MGAISVCIKSAKSCSRTALIPFCICGFCVSSCLARCIHLCEFFGREICHLGSLCVECRCGCLGLYRCGDGDQVWHIHAAIAIDIWIDVRTRSIRKVWVSIVGCDYDKIYQVDNPSRFTSVALTGGSVWLLLSYSLKFSINPVIGEKSDIWLPLRFRTVRFVNSLSGEISDI